MNAIRDEMKIAKALCDHAVSEAHDKVIAEQVFLSTQAKAKAAITRKQHAKELLITKKECDIALLITKKECDIAIGGMKRRLRSTLKRKDKMSSAILRKQAAKSKVIIKKSRVTIKRYKTENATSEATICNLEEKVAAFESTLEQLKRSHENAMIDLTTAHRRRVSSIHSRHFSSLIAEKQKLRLRMINERQLQNSLYDEVLDTRQCVRDACNSVRSYDVLSSKRLIRMKEWRSKCSQIADNQDELVDRLCDMEVMEEQLQEYYDAAATSSNQIR